MLFADRDRLDVGSATDLAAAARLAPRWLHLASLLRVAAIDPGAEDEVACSARTLHVAMARDVLGAALGGGVSQLVLPSSVLAADASSPPSPDALSHVGMNLAIEAAGRAAAGRGLDVVCVRLGAVQWPDRPAAGCAARAHWLSHDDCAALFAAVLSAPVVRGRFVTVTAVSRLEGERDDAANPFGWRPQTTRVGGVRWLKARVVDLKCRAAASPAGPALRTLVRSGRSLYAQAARRPGTEDSWSAPRGR